MRGRIGPALALGAAQLIAAVGGAQARALHSELHKFDADAARAAAIARDLAVICRCQDCYPPSLRVLENPPAVLYVAGGLARLLELTGTESVAVVGARRASAYGLEVARSLGRSLGIAGVTVVSGMAMGIDSATHEGALAGRGGTVAVLPGGADRPYPASKRPLYARLLGTGTAISELPPGTAPRRWMFPARNRIIAGLAAMTVVVEAAERSGALVTARIATSLGREVGAVPGRVTTLTAAGTNALLADGARVVRDAQDVLDELFGAGVRTAHLHARPELTGELKALLAAIADGHDTAGALERAGFPAAHVLATLASLELAGYLRRGPGGRFSVVP